jgi:drug/metabolite transporter (DMT)-like permease
MLFMEFRTTGLGLVLLSVFLLTATQLIIKSRLDAHGAIPFLPGEFHRYLMAVIQDWRLMLGLVTLVLGALCWYAAISRLPLSLAFPFAALSYPLIFAGSVLILGEPFSWMTMFGNVLIVVGVMIVANGS